MSSRSYFNKKILFVTLAIVSVIGYGFVVFAAAPTGGYTPGSTLNPDCAPGDTDCLVTLPGVSIGDTIHNSPDLNGVLYTNASGQLVTDNMFTRNAVTKETVIGRDFSTSQAQFDLDTSHVLSMSSFSNSFSQGDQIVGDNSGATATFEYFANGIAYVSNVVGTFQNEPVTDVTSSETAVITQVFPATPFAVSDNFFILNPATSNYVGSGTITAVTGNTYTITITSGTLNQYYLMVDNPGSPSKIVGILDGAPASPITGTANGSFKLGQFLGGFIQGAGIEYRESTNDKFATSFAGSFAGSNGYSAGMIIGDNPNHRFASVLTNLYGLGGSPSIELGVTDSSNNSNNNIILNGNRMVLQNNSTIALLAGRIQIGEYDFVNDDPDQKSYPAFPTYYYLPSMRGSAGQVMTDDGNGNLFWSTPSGGGSGWALTGNSISSGNFLGTINPEDLVLKTNGSEIARFGQGNNIALGNGALAVGDNSFAVQDSCAQGNRAIAIGTTCNSFSQFGAWNDLAIAMGYNASAQGLKSVAIGSKSVAYSDYEIALGSGNSSYTPVGLSPMGTFNDSWSDFDRLLSIGNGNNGQHNAYTLWKDGSFAYNDDNFQNDSGNRQNMFYFNYGNHDGLGGAQNKHAIRLGSSSADEWDINSNNVGDYSIAVGFANQACISGTSTSISSGQGSISIGCANVAFGRRSVAIGDGNQALGDNSTAFGGSKNIAQGVGSVAFGSGVTASSDYETAFGTSNTVGTNRLVSVGNGMGVGLESDAFTILKNGQTGIAIDNFETNTNGNIFQVGDGSTNIIGYVDDITGNWVAVSDERKKDNITDLSYGLNELLQLRPTSFNYKRNGEHTIGFIAQQVLPIIPEAVYGTESEGYGMSYATLTPVIVKAIQEMNLNITMLSDTARPNTWREALIAWFESTTNGIRSLVVKDKICVDNECLTKDDIHALLQLKNQTIPPAINIYPVGPNNPPVIPPDSGTPPPDDNSGGTPSEPVPPSEPTPSDSGSNPSPDVGTSE